MSAIALTYFVLTLLWLYALHRRDRVSNKVYPPGPKGLYLIGNLRDIPTSGAPYKYSSWRKQYGDLVYLNALGQHILVINSRKVATELLDKRSKNYSSRPDVPVIDMMNWGFLTVSIKYSNRWRIHRRLYQHFLLPRHSNAYRPIQTEIIHNMIREILDTPDKFACHYRNMAGAVIMKIIYGIDITSDNDSYIEVAEAAVKNISQAAVPGAMLVNILPILRHIPAWFPGAQFKRFTDATKILTHKMLNDPFETVKRNASNSEQSCVASQLLARLHDGRSESAAEEEAIKEVCATSYAAGADTIVSAISTFFYAMTLWKEAQVKAQKEIDQVIGNARLPGYQDRDSLPYVEALYREVMRFQPVSPLGLPHYSINDDVYDGYFIPKGTTILPNVWAMTHDEMVYPNPNEFKPERFLKPDGQLSEDNFELTFGFGRRICPGRHMGRDTIWLTIATVLAVFDIDKANDEAGNVIPVSVTYSDGFVSHPSAFKCSITPRGEVARKLIIASQPLYVAPKMR